MTNKRSTITQILQYLGIGVGTALLELGLFELLFEILHIDIVVSNVIAVIVATTVNFLLNGTVTFRGSSNFLRSVILYILLFLFNLFFTSTAISLLVEAGVNSAIAKVATQICVTIWNFILYRKVVFV